IATSFLVPDAAWITTFMWEKSMPPVITPSGGMMMSLTSDETTLPNAAPMTTATARSTTLPRMMNALKSFAKLIAYSFSGMGRCASPAASRRTHLGTPAAPAQHFARSGNPSFQHGNALQFGTESVATLQRPHARGRAGENQVAGFQFEQLRQLGNDLRHRKNHVSDIGVLTRFAVYAERQPRMLRMSDIADGAQR